MLCHRMCRQLASSRGAKSIVNLDEFLHARTDRLEVNPPAPDTDRHVLLVSDLT